MSKKSIFVIVVTLFISFLLSSCMTYKYSKLGVPGVRKVDKYDGDTPIATDYQKYDHETLAWYEAEKKVDGQWDFSTRGKWERELKIRELQSGGGG